MVSIASFRMAGIVVNAVCRVKNWMISPQGKLDPEHAYFPGCSNLENWAYFNSAENATAESLSEITASDSNNEVVQNL
jgi:hypothetical protein